MRTYPTFVTLLTSMAKDEQISGGKNTYSLFGGVKVEHKHEAGQDETEKNIDYPRVFGMLEEAKYFVVDEAITKLLELTDIPKNVDTTLIRLPYPVVYIDADLGDIKGILVTESVLGTDEERLKLLSKWVSDTLGRTVTEDELKISIGEKTRSFYIHYCWVEKDKEGKVLHYWIRHTALFVESEIGYMKKIIQDVKMTPISKKVREFIFAFLLFLNQPEVELKDIVRSEKNREKAIKRGKIPLPPTTEVNVTGKLKIYINKLKSGGHFSYSYQFWVRGHFRTLRNKQRYGEKAGTTIWIAPYIKGRGILINKDYNVHRVEKEEEDGRLKDSNV